MLRSDAAPALRLRAMHQSMQPCAGFAGMVGHSLSTPSAWGPTRVKGWAAPSARAALSMSTTPASATCAMCRPNPPLPACPSSPPRRSAGLGGSPCISFRSTPRRPRTAARSQDGGCDAAQVACSLGSPCTPGPDPVAPRSASAGTARVAHSWQLRQRSYARHSVAGSMGDVPAQVCHRPAQRAPPAARHTRAAPAARPRRPPAMRWGSR